MSPVLASRPAPASRPDPSRPDSPATSVAELLTGDKGETASEIAVMFGNW